MTLDHATNGMMRTSIAHDGGDGDDGDGDGDDDDDDDDDDDHKCLLKKPSKKELSII